jgi:hypothetical protein
MDEETPALTGESLPSTSGQNIGQMDSSSSLQGAVIRPDGRVLVDGCRD